MLYCDCSSATGVMTEDDLAAYLSIFVEVDDTAVLEDVLDSMTSLLQPGSTTREQVLILPSAKPPPPLDLPCCSLLV